MSNYGGRVKKDRADRKMKAKTWTWFDVVKGLKIEDELEIANSEKSGNESEVADSVEMFDSEELNQLKAKPIRGQRKVTPTCRSQWVEKRRSNSSEGVEMGLMSRQADQEGRGALNRTG